MSRTLKTLALVIAIVAVLTLTVGGTVYAFSRGHCGTGDSGCGQESQVGCDGSGNRCGEPHDCAGSRLCNTNAS